MFWDTVYYFTACVMWKLHRWMCQVKLVTVVKGDLKAPFSLATTVRCKEGHCSFLWIVPLYPWCIPYNAECWARSYQVSFFLSLWYDLTWAIDKHSTHSVNDFKNLSFMSSNWAIGIQKQPKNLLCKRWKYG